MSATITVARNEILALLKAAMDANGAFSTVVKIYQDSDKTPPDDGTTSWVEISVLHNPDGTQSSLGGATSGRKFLRTGVVVVKVMTPKGGGLNTSDALCTILLGAYEGQTTASGVWFRNVGLVEVGNDGKYHQTNVIASFEYEEHK